MSRQPFTILITGAGTATCQSVIKGLRGQDQFPVRIVTVDMSDANAGRWMSDAFYVVPAASDSGFISSLWKICQTNRVDLLIPIVDYEFQRIATEKQRFEDLGCCVAISDPDVIEICNDKWKTFQFLQRQDIGTPATWLPDHFDVSTANFPLFVKPQLMGRALIDTFRVDSAAQLKQLLPSMETPLIQTWARGREYTVDLLCDFQGKAVNGVVRERIETKSGISYKGRTVRHERILHQAVQIANALPICGPVNMQCFDDGTRISFFDINPRFSGGLVLSVAAGFNSPLALMQLAMGIHPDCRLGDYRAGVQMFRYWEEVFVGSDQQPVTFPGICGSATTSSGNSALSHM